MSLLKQRHLFEESLYEQDSFSKNHNTTFIDLCAGIGAGRIGLEKEGFKCLGFSEIDNKAVDTYISMHGNNHINLNDLTLLNCNKIPNVDLLIAGFPCQAFSIVGKRKGFEDERGKIIFSINKILNSKNIKYFILENVKGLVNMDNGKTLRNILKLLSKSGYFVHHKVLNSFNYGTPQLRERVYFVGIKKDLPNTSYYFPESSNITDYELAESLIDENPDLVLQEDTKKYETFIRYLNNKYNNGRHSPVDLLKENYLILDTRQSDLRLYRGKIPTLRMGRHGILYTKEGCFRYISGKEALLLQGFSKDYLSKIEHKSNTALLSQAGNAMTINVISSIAKNLIPIIKRNQEY